MEELSLLYMYMCTVDIWAPISENSPWPYGQNLLIFGFFAEKCSVTSTAGYEPGKNYFHE